MVQDGLPFRRGSVPPGFRRRTVLLAAGGRRPYESTEWAGALVVIERGELELETCAGQRWRFREGDVLCLADLPLAALESPGPADTLLVAVSRRRG
jgi:hypothetical protein